MTLTELHRLLQRVFITLSCIVSAGCAASGPAGDAGTGSETATAEPVLYVADGIGLARVTASSSARQPIRAGVSFGGLYVPRTGSHDVVVTLRAGPKTQLALLSADGSFRTVDEYEGPATYTVAWSKNGDLAFGYAAAGRRGVGIVRSDGTVSNVGCTASSRAYGWASPQKLVVGDGSNNYLVAAKGCATLSRVDARKMHEASFNPVWPTVAYVLRELEYDRKARQYVPDSSLYVAGVDGSDPHLIVGDRYKPHRPSWSPDGIELAFDARTPDRPNRRLISIYDAERKEAAFLNPSAVASPISEWDAHWSPSGQSIAYLQRTENGQPTVTVRPMHDSFVTAVGESGERFARWIDDQHLVVTDGKRERIVSTDGRTSLAGPDGATILWVR